MQFDSYRSSKNRLPEQGAAIPLIIVFITVILIFAGLALDTTVLSVSKTEHRQLAENVALAALSTYLNTNPADPLDTRLDQVKFKTQEIIQGNIKFAKPFMVSPSNTDNIDTRRGTTVDGVDGTLVPGNWYSTPPSDCTIFPAGTVCPCDGGSNPWTGACFQEIDLDSATPPPAVNAFRADLRLTGGSAVKTLFSTIFSNASDSSLANTATATTYPRQGIFAVDLSRSSHEDTHQQYESSIGHPVGIQLSAEYTFSVSGSAADVTLTCTPGAWNPATFPVGHAQCDIKGGSVPQLYRNVWFGSAGFNFIPLVRPAAPELRKHYKPDYVAYDLSYSDPGIPVSPVSKTYLVDMRIEPAATATSYEGPEPLNSMLAGVNRGLARVAANTVPGDQMGFLGFDYSARVTERIFVLSTPGSVTYQRLQNISDPTVIPAAVPPPPLSQSPLCLEDGTRDVRECRVRNHFLITRAESGSHLPEALRQAHQMFLDAGNPLGAEQFVIIMSDGITNCSRAGTNPGDNQRVCGNDAGSVNTSMSQVEGLLTNTYTPNSIKAHFIHIGDAAGPHTLLAPSPFRKNSNGTSAGCMTEDEAQKYSSNSTTPLNNFDNTGSDYQGGMLNNDLAGTKGTFIPATATYTRAVTFFEPNRLRSSVALTGGKWFPIRQPCQPGNNLTNYLDGLCNGMTFSPPPATATGQRPNVRANEVIAGAPPTILTDGQGRLICEPDDSDTYAPNPAPAPGAPLQPRSSKRTQIMRAIDQILSRSPYIIVQ